MDYDDEALLSQEDYKKMAKAYKEQSQTGYIFVRLDREKELSALQEALQTLSLLKSNLFALGGFLGTGALYNLNNKHLDQLQNIYGQKAEYRQHNFVPDKTKCFLNMLSLESLALNKLISLALCTSYSEEIVAIIKERTSLCSSLFHINGIISTFSH